MSNQSRDEFLFWKMLEMLEQDADAEYGYSVFGSHGDIRGMRHYGLADPDNLSVLIRLSFCINSEGVSVRLTAKYHNIGLSKEAIEDFSRTIANNKILAENFFLWKSFDYNVFANWILENGDWDMHAAKAATNRIG